jgi:pre-rRNA-processing protein TSR4
MFEDEDEGVVLLGVPKIKKKKNRTSDNDVNASFLGGRPKWYGPCTNRNDDVLNRTLKCGKCRKGLLLVSQIYAPTDDLIRHLLVYGCNDGACGNIPGGFRVLRIQSPYSEDAETDCTSKESESNSTSWVVEGNDDWTVDGADEWGDDGEGDWNTTSSLKEKKSTTPPPPTMATTSAKKQEVKTLPPPKSFLVSKAFPLCELDTIQEPYECFDDDKEKLSISAAAVAMEALKLDVEESVASGETYESVPQDRKLFLRFRRRVSRYPSQCFRYAYGGEPLWNNFVAERDGLKIPDCAGCGAKRIFEVQLTPQVLHCLRVDDFAAEKDDDENMANVSSPPSAEYDKNKNNEKMQRSLSGLSAHGMDWGGMYIYSCPNSCNESCEEYIYVTPAD